MDLLTNILESRLPALGRAKKLDNPLVFLKFVDIERGWAWYIMEGSKLEANEELILSDEGIVENKKFPHDMVFYGIIQGFKEEFGHFYLSDLQSRKNQKGEPSVQVDFSFRPKRLKKLAFDHLRR